MIKTDRSGGFTNQELYQRPFDRNQRGGYKKNYMRTEVFGNPNIHVRNDPKFEQAETKHARYGSQKNIQNFKDSLL